ncbi:hypothetical protein GPJ56_002797 [Histomonas meleagridis]|uniref:uncharacterized protein n=1 Tax=Histomonas meleagridis TaxID=135588 RepID=UPI00355A7436|nr:hypothetical protein GPJ56_002797 [Histomonas meleagridis]KAH0806313.1 hypothetical protein GO595_001001 [Histomonas meleagridis]
MNTGKLENPLSISLRETLKLRPKAPELIKILRAIEADLDELEIQNADVSDLAVYIHQLYLVNNTTVHGYLIKIITELEVLSAESIIEMYHFDYLISQSLDQRPPDPQPKVDEEKNACFRIISLLLKYRKYLPYSILRALVSLYQTPKHGYKPLITAYFCEACLVCPNQIVSIPDIPQLLIENLMETGNTLISSLLTYSVEHFPPFIFQKHFFSHLATPFCSLADNNNKDENLQTSSKSLINILITWPGLLHIGFKEHIFDDLLQCLPHRTECIITILKSLLHLNQNRSILFSYQGLLLHNLIEIGLLTQLHKVSIDNSHASTFLNYLVPFISNEKTADLLPMITHENKIIMQSCDSLAFKLSRFVAQQQTTTKTNQQQQLQSQQQIITVCGCSIQGDNDLTWNWIMLLKLLSVILPHDISEATTTNAKALYNKLLDYFSGPYLQSKSLKATSTKSDCLVALCSLLMNDWGTAILQTHQNFIKSLYTAMTEILTSDKPNWAYFRCVNEFMKTPEGTVFLQKNKIGEILSQIEIQDADVERVKELISYINLSTDLCIGVQMYLNLLESKSEEIQKLILNSLNEMKDIVPDFHTCVFKRIIILHFKRNKEIPGDLKLLTNILTTNELCLEMTANDPEMHQILQKRSHQVYSLLFGIKEGFKYGNVMNELQWWLDTGNLNYVKIFDEQTEYAINNPNEFVNIPIHLFGQLCKTKIGREKVINYIPILLEKLDNNKSLNEKRSVIYALGQFGSNIKSIEIMKEYKVLETFMELIKSTKSYVLKGTLITSFSLMAQSQYLSEIIEKNKFISFKFGNNVAIIPNDLEVLFENHEKIDPPLNNIDEIEGFENVTLLIRQVSSPISQKQAKVDLHALYQNEPMKLIEPKLAIYANELMSKFVISPENRLFLIRIFSRTSMYSLKSQKERDVNEEKAANLRAKIFSILEYNYELPLTMVNVKQYNSLKELKNKEKKLCNDAVEVYLNDEEFEKVKGMTKKEFYDTIVENNENIHTPKATPFPTQTTSYIRTPTQFKTSTHSQSPEPTPVKSFISTPTKSYVSTPTYYPTNIPVKPHDFTPLQSPTSIKTVVESTSVKTLISKHTESTTPIITTKATFSTQIQTANPTQIKSTISSTKSHSPIPTSPTSPPTTTTSTKIYTPTPTTPPSTPTTHIQTLTPTKHISTPTSHYPTPTPSLPPISPHEGKLTISDRYDRIFKKINTINNAIKTANKQLRDSSISNLNALFGDKLFEFMKLQEEHAYGIIHKILHEQPTSSSLCAISPLNGTIRKHSFADRLMNVLSQDLKNKNLPKDTEDCWNMSPPIGNFSYILQEPVYASRIMFKSGKAEACSIKDFAVEFYFGNTTVYTGVKHLYKYSLKPQSFAFNPNIKCDGYKIIVLSNYGDPNITCHYGVKLYRS